MSQLNSYPSPFDERIVTFFAGLRSFLKIVAEFLAIIVVWITMPESLKLSPYIAVWAILWAILLIFAIPSFRSGYAQARSVFENLWFYETPDRRAGFLWWSLSMLGRGLLFYVRLGFPLSLMVAIITGLTQENASGLGPPLVATLTLSIPLYGFPLLLEKIIMYFFDRHIANRKAAFAKSSGKGYMIQERKPSESYDSPVALSQDEQEIVAFADALLDTPKADTARAELVSRGKSAGRVLALLLAGNVTQSKWRYWAHSADDISLDPLRKLEQALVAIGPDAAPFVRPLLRHPRWTTQFTAINTLGDLKDRESLDDILKLLEQPSDRITMAAAEAVGKIGDPTAIPYLEKSLEKATWWDQGAIALAIRNLRTVA